MNKTKKERRRELRAALNSLVFCRYSAGQEHVIEGIAENISQTGILVVSQHLISPRENVHMEIYQPCSLDQRVRKIIAIHMIGEVKWTGRVSIATDRKITSGFMMGIDFLEGSKNDLEVIENYINIFNIQSEAKII